MITNEDWKPAEYNTGIMKGDDFREEFTFSVDGNIIDLSLGDPVITLKNSFDLPFRVFSIGDQLKYNGSTLVWTIPSSNTSTYSLDVYEYKLEVNIYGSNRTFLKGNFIVDAI